MNQGVEYSGTYEEHKVHMIAPEIKGKYPVYYLHIAIDEVQMVWNHLKHKDVILVRIESTSFSGWQNEMTPWQAPGLRKNEAPFGGMAQNYLDRLINQMIIKSEDKLIEEGYGVTYRGLVGYSLGGLFSVYAAFFDQKFKRKFSHIASISGSLWYDDFLEAIWSKEPPKEMKWYFSLGNQEAKTRNQRMAKVEKATLEVVQLLREKQIPEKALCFEMNEGNHFKEVALRVAKGIDWLSQETKG